MLRLALSLFFPLPCLVFSLTLQEVNDPQNGWMDLLIRRQFSLLKPHHFSRKILDKAYAEQTEFVFRFQIKNHQYIGPPSATGKVIAQLAQDLPLPNLDALYFNANGPTSMGQLPLTEVALLAGSKHQDMDNVILFHHPYFIPQPNGEYVEDQILQAALEESDYPWESRKEQLIWRGSNSGMELYTQHNWMKLYRGRLVYFSSLYPDLIDAKFTHLHPFKCIDSENLKKVVPLDKPLSLKELSHYKYQMILKGDTAVAYSFLLKIALGSVVFKPESPFVMWFYDALIPYVHYVPVKDSLSNLPTQIKKARLLDEEMAQIAGNGKEFARNHLRSKDLLIYCYKVLCAYAAMQRDSGS